MKTPDITYLKDYCPPPFLVDRIDLEFDISGEQTLVTSTMQIRKNPEAGDSTAPLVFDKGPYDILSVVAGGMVLLPSEYHADDRSFRLNSTPERFTLEIKSRLLPEKNTTLEGLYKSNGVYTTQCEAEGFRKITPFPDRPDVMAVYSCTIIADKTQCPVLLSNGNPVDRGDLDGNRHYARWEDPFKKPCYLFALVAGDLAHIRDTVVTRSGRQVELRIYSEKENIDKCGHAMASLKQAVKWDEDRFGLEYDLDLYQIVAINDFNAGAMENKGLNIFNSKYVLADPKTATDDDFMAIQGVIAHEYFHNWTGNRVTLKNWFQLSLKEGLTVFRDQEFSSDLNSRAVKRIADVRALRAFQFPEDEGPMTHPVRPESYIKMDNFYTMTVYEKGAEVIRMIHTLLGEEAFQKGMQLYFQRHDGMAVTTEDFVSAMADASGKDLSLFQRWYAQSGTPRITLARAYDPDTRTLSLTFTQATRPDRNQAAKNPLHIPVRFALIDETGNEVQAAGSDLLELTSETASYTFENVAPGTMPSVFRRFSAPVKIETDFTDSDLAFLMANDTDAFNRWDAAQTLFVKEIKTLVDAIRQDKPLAVSQTLVDAFGKALTGADTEDRAFLAKALAIPQETELKDHFETIDVMSIHSARSHLKKTLAAELETAFYDTVDQCKKADPDSISHDAVGDRSLKNLALSYIGSLDDPGTVDFLFGEFRNAGNMTEEFGAFRILSHMDETAKEKSADLFYQKWQHDKLVLDKWFQVQAASMLPDTLDRVKALTEHPDFTLTNPNKVRSLVYVFALQNPVGFHHESGAGYEFIARQILTLDKINHQISARLAGCFNLWKKYDDLRRPLMRNALETIIGQERLSKNVYEIVSRALA